MRHLIDPTDLTVEETEQIVALAEDIIAHRAKYSEACKGKKLATLFYEPSTRTRLSFTAAMLELGGQVIGFSDANSSSVSKGETVADTVRVIRCFADIIAMRHFKEGAPLVASQYAGIPVINAGDGSHSHPTQTLTDLLTIKREKGRFDNLTIGFCGDLKFGRTVHSLIKALSRYSGIKVILISPEELRLPDYMLNEMRANSRLEFREVRTMEEVMPELDILYMTRVQKERFLDEEEFDRVKNSFVLDPGKLRTARKDMIILHPLPRVNEITRAVDNDPRAAYFRQVENGKVVSNPEGGMDTANYAIEREALIPADGKGDHPSFMILTEASKALEKIGVHLIVTDLSDSTQLWDTIEADQADMFAAAWGATVDPDMYQIYFSGMDGKAAGGSNYMYDINDAELNQLILDARASLDQSYRKTLYKSCLDIIVDWAVEVPVYQRQNAIIFSTQRVNMNTVTPDITTFYGWLSEVEKIELN